MEAGRSRPSLLVLLVLSEIEHIAETRIPRSTGRLVGYCLIVLALLSTLAVNLYTLTQVARARTSVPYADQWVVVQELEQYGRGAALWPILWSPSWGHRLVIQRLLFLADARWFSLGSLTWLNVFLQFVHIGFLIALAWKLLGRRPPALFMIAVTGILNLMLSPFQMENFVWSMQTMFPLVFVAATGAFLCLSAGSARIGSPFLLLCVAFGVISSCAMPNGILVWPLLVVQVLYLRQNRKVLMALAGVGAGVISFYLWHYQRPLFLGLGAAGILRHPVDAALLLGLLVGSPFRLSIPADVIVGLVGIAATGYIFIRVLFSPMHERRWFSALFAIVLFSLLSSLSIVAGRLTPEFLHLDSKDPIPGRYFTMICLLWVSIGLLALSTLPGRLRRLLLCLYGVLFVGLMFTSMRRQLSEAEDWADFFVKVDAVGSAFILDVPDEQLESALWASRPEREERILFLRQHSLAMFHEPRARWLGKRVLELFPTLPGRCGGAIEKEVGLHGQGWRLEGWAWDPDLSRAPDDILFTDPTGRVIGFARGGLRHGYSPGFVIVPEFPPPSHAQFPHSEWLGYVRQGGEFRRQQVSLYGLFRNVGKVCAVR